ncbi:MAG TPA: hypothetical protein VFP68_12095, partial [Burkholderiaceae bacterium]|nr:hypothetical protein [Burkholderiaceae bacterium]
MSSIRHSAAVLILTTLIAVFLVVSGPAVAATLGNTAVGSRIDTGDANSMNGSRFTMPSIGGTVSSMSVYIANIAAAPNNQYQVAIYSDNGGRPATLVASSGTRTLNANAWNTVALSARLEANTPYWLMYNTNGNSASVNNMRYSSGGTDAYSKARTAFGSWPANFGSSVLGGLRFSIYASYTPDVADASAPSAPGMLSATGGAGSASLSWSAATDNVGVTGYAVYRSMTSGFAPSSANRIAQTSGTTTTYLDSGLQAGTYYYLVTASDAAGNVGPPSNQAAAVVTAGVDPRATVGEWSSPVNLPNVMQHAILLPGSTRILYFEAGTSARVLEPITQSITAVPAASNLFCAGHALLADGRPIVIGGDTESPSAAGLVDTNRFDPSTNTWTRLADMAYKRWYPTATRLSDGRILALSGSSDGCLSCFAQTPEVFDPAANAWTKLTGATANIPYYPFAYVLPDGRLVQVGASEQATTTQVLNIATQSWSTVDSRVIDAGSSTMYRPGLILKAGTASDGNTAVRPSSPNAYVLDMTAPAPSWQTTASMAYPRAFLNLTTLPDGTVLATGGETTADGTNANNAVKAAESWSP